MLLHNPISFISNPNVFCMAFDHLFVVLPIIIFPKRQHCQAFFTTLTFIDSLKMSCPIFCMNSIFFFYLTDQRQSNAPPDTLLALRVGGV